MFRGKLRHRGGRTIPQRLPPLGRRQLRVPRFAAHRHPMRIPRAGAAMPPPGRRRASGLASSGDRTSGSWLGLSPGPATDPRRAEGQARVSEFSAISSSPGPSPQVCRHTRTMSRIIRSSRYPGLRMSQVNAKGRRAAVLFRIADHIRRPGGAWRLRRREALSLLDEYAKRSRVKSQREIAAHGNTCGMTDYAAWASTPSPSPSPSPSGPSVSHSPTQ